MKRSSMRKNFHQPGFSMLELSIVLGCISVLVAIAIPQFQRSYNRAHTIEATATSNTIERQLVEYYNRNNQYPPAPGGAQNPTQPISAGKVQWTDGLPGWNDIGFVGNGSYFYRYEFIPTFNAAAGRYDQVTIHAWTQLVGETTQDEFFIYLNDGYREGDVEFGE